MAIKKNKGGVRDPSKATKHQLVTENLGGDSPVFLYPAHSYLFSPVWTPMDLWEGSLKGEWLRQDWELFGCVFVCVSAFIFKEEFRGLGPFAGLCTASNFFTPCSLSIYKCLILSVHHMLQHMTKASMLLLLVTCIVWWPLCTWVFRSAFYSGKLWRAKDTGVGIVRAQKGWYCL